jgi:TetR/AcrR family transcriptional regulator, transcriptional repressor for nem operon
VTFDEHPGPSRNPTPRGSDTRERILLATAALLRERGAAATTLDDICVASATSKSQLYHHFGDKDAIVVAAVEARAAGLLADQQRALANVRDVDDLQRWRDTVVARNAVDDGRYGCVLGSLTTQLSDRNESARVVLEDAFNRWGDLLASCLERLRVAGRLDPQADVQRLAVGIVAALHGGYILAQAARESQPLADALDMALARVRALTRPRP